MFGKLDTYVDGIMKDLFKPENHDLLFAVRDLGDSDEENFMFGFTHFKKPDFDSFCLNSHLIDAMMPEFGVEPDLRSMSVRYDEYLARVDRLNEFTISEQQTKRFDDIVNRFDDGWSGAIYGLIMRRVQFLIRRMFNN
jgi:hypothetical protein